MRELFSSICARFQRSPASEVPFAFYGCPEMRSSDHLHGGQPSYCPCIAHLQNEASCLYTPPPLSQLTWLTLSRSDMTAPVNILAQLTTDPFNAEHISMVNRVIGQGKAHTYTGLSFSATDVESLHLLANSDESFAPNWMHHPNWDS